MDQIIEKAKNIAAAIGAMPLDQAVETLNAVRAILHSSSPFREEPVDLVTWVRSDTIRGNSYNPNTVAPPEMRLLRRSIEADGYTQPIVACAEGDGVVVVDGFHRHRVGKESSTVRKRVKGYLPVTAIRTERNNAKDRIASTIRHNRARGVHGVEPMRDIVVTLLREGWADEEVAKEVGMDADEVLRFKQIAGLPELFRNVEWSKAWE
ncbi:IbrB-like domain-containing protein [Aureimonas psammosilenae]|uniref:IbrB-like domain-containing protein n=1 Tax=Aureimonas psammosilenae TaxID=2495496 RepID=UPI001AED4249|nr:ParB/RepB/Spo0J family partition protein [Aureimonas psammosilenae]